MNIRFLINVTMFPKFTSLLAIALLFSTGTLAQQTRQRAELVVQTGHVSSEVYAVAFSPNGRILASGADNVKLWDVESGLELRSLKGHVGYVASVAFSPDGNILANGGADNSLELWDVASGKELFSLTSIENFHTVSSVCFSPDGKTLASGNWDGTVKLWDVSSGKQLASFTADADKVRAVSFSPDGKFLASAGDDRTIKLWEVNGAHLIASLKGHGAGITSLAFSRDSKILASAGEDKVIKLWDPARGTELRELVGHSAPVRSLSFSRDNATLASAGDDKTVKQWVVASGELKSSFVAADEAEAVAFSPNRHWLANGAGAMIQLWDATTGRELGTFKGHVQFGYCAAFSEDGKTLLVGTQDGKLQVWDLAGGKAPRVLKAHTDWVFKVTFSPDSSTIASVGADHVVRLWEVSSGKAGPILAVADVQTYLTFSPDSKTLYGATYGNTIKHWDRQTGKLLDETPYSDENLKRLNLPEPHPETESYDATSEKLLARGSPTGVDLFDRKTGASVCDLIIIDEHDWLVVTPKGFFDGSTEAWKRVLWRLDDNTFKVAPVEAFFSDFFRPGLLQDIFAGNVPTDDIDISRKDIRQPSVRLSLTDAATVEKSLSHETDEKGSTMLSDEGVSTIWRKLRTDAKDTGLVSIKVEISDAPAGARDVRLFRNGALVRVWRGDVLKEQRNTAVYATVPVVAGENVFTAYAFNRDNVKSGDATLTVIGDSKLKRQGTIHVLAIGIDEYANSQYNLKYAVADAQAFGEEVKRQQAKLNTYAAVEIVPLNNESATKAAILRALRDLSVRTQPEDAIIVYFAGHGTAQNNRFYLIPTDLGYQGPRERLSVRGLQSILANSISDEELQSSFEAFRGGQQLILIIDACNSGQALEAEEKRRGPMNSKGLAQLAYEKGMYVLTAAQSYQAAIETQQRGHGYLTYALVEEGLKTASADVEPRDGQVTLREWLDYATRRVPDLQRADTKSEVEELRQLEREKPSQPAPASIARRENPLQQPRVFYRRELEMTPLIVARPNQR
jgi:WD40 repeat protein/uncharacterized caspase-like protein